jgi:DNA repair protein RecN (Recombination protein N)
MTVLTGETGAGKTALLGALKLLLGDRADSGSVRAGAAELLVEGRFAAGGQELLARRRVSSDGRSRCAIDGEMATVGALAERVGPLVDLHGQHEHQALLSSATHIGYLDRWAGETVGEALAAYRQAREGFLGARARRDALEARIAEAARNADYWAFVLDEIERVSPQPGEDELLESRLPALQHGERLAQVAGESTDLIRGDGGAQDLVARAEAALEKVGGIDPRLDGIAARLTELVALIDDAGAALRDYRDLVEHDPAVLDQVLTRLSELSGLKKKHGPTLDEVLRTRDAAQAVLAVTADSQDARTSAEQAVKAAESELRTCASSLDTARREAAPAFSAQLESAAADLAMDGARFEVRFDELPFESWSSLGPARVEFLYAPAPGQPPRPLTRIASGGEISRVMLALKGVLGEADSVETLVFDEVDAGIGGATARAVGQRLAELAETHQVIVVTHLAQVAAHARRHLVVRKEIVDGAAATSVLLIEGEDRVAEIARMLSGKDSTASLAHAAELIASVGAATTGA